VVFISERCEGREQSGCVSRGYQHDGQWIEKHGEQEKNKGLDGDRRLVNFVRSAKQIDEYVCLAVCLSVLGYLGNHSAVLCQISCILIVAMARYCSGGIAIRYVFPVL